MEFQYSFEDGELWRVRYDVQNIPEFCGGKQLCYFSYNMAMYRATREMYSSKGKDEEAKEKFQEFAKAFHEDISNRHFFCTNMRAVWWENDQRGMYYVGKALRARAGRKFSNPNSGNIVSQFSLKIK